MEVQPSFFQISKIPKNSHIKMLFFCGIIDLEFQIKNYKCQMNFKLKIPTLVCHSNFPLCHSDRGDNGVEESQI